MGIHRIKIAKVAMVYLRKIPLTCVNWGKKEMKYLTTVDLILVVSWCVKPGRINRISVTDINGNKTILF